MTDKEKLKFLVNKINQECKDLYKLSKGSPVSSMREDMQNYSIAKEFEKLLKIFADLNIFPNNKNFEQNTKES